MCANSFEKDQKNTSKNNIKKKKREHLFSNGAVTQSIQENHQWLVCNILQKGALLKRQPFEA